MFQSQQPVLVVHVAPDPDDCLWFDDWGEGPFTRAQVDRFCEGDPHREAGYFRYPERCSYFDWKRAIGA